MRQVSASNVEPFVKCGASHVLPQAEVWMAKTESGTDNHKLVGDAINNAIGGNARLASALPALAEKLPFLLDGVSNPRAEAAYVVDVQARTSTFLGYDIGRDYAGKLGRDLGDYELGVSLDADGIKSGVPWIRDFKFGVYHSWWQLYVQAMAILWTTGKMGDEVDAGFYFVDVRNDEVWVTEQAETLYAMDLDDRADEIMKAFDRAREYEDMTTSSLDASQIGNGLAFGDLPTVEGKWCQYCGAFPHCPSKWKLAKSLLEMDVIGSVATMTLEQCGAAWKKLGVIEKNIIDKTKDALKERMRTEGGFPLEHGKKLAVLQMPGRASLDKPAVVALLLSKGVTQDEIRALTKQGAPYDQVREIKS